MKVIKDLKKLSILLGIFTIFLSFNPEVEAAEATDLYAVIYNDVSAWNGDVAQANWITSAILYAGERYGVDPLLITAIMETESHFNIAAGSNAGAIGLMQLMPATAAAIGVDPRDPLGNICGGVAHLRTLLDSFAGWGEFSGTVAVAAYNAGAGRIQEYNGVPPFGETRDYVIKVYTAYKQLLTYC